MQPFQCFSYSGSGNAVIAEEALQLWQLSSSSSSAFVVQQQQQLSFYSSAAAAAQQIAALQPCSSQPCSLAALQPRSHAASQPCSHAALQPCSLAAVQPRSPAALQPLAAPSISRAAPIICHAAPIISLAALQPCSPFHQPCNPAAAVNSLAASKQRCSCAAIHSPAALLPTSVRQDTLIRLQIPSVMPALQLHCIEFQASA